MVIDGTTKEIIKGLRKATTKNRYAEGVWKGNGLTVTLYKTGKLLIQGKNAGRYKEKPIDKENSCIIGTDESLKGDTFGGLVVAGVRTKAGLRELIHSDSKRISDIQVHKIAEEIMKNFPYSVQELMPEELNKAGSITKVLNKLHKRCYDELKTSKCIHIVDKFPGCNVGDIAEFKADEHYPEVAAASIIARHFALKQIESLSKKAGFKLPLGSTHVRGALILIKQKGLPIEKFAKTSFRNVKEIFTSF